MSKPASQCFLESLSKEDGNGEDNARKQWSVKWEKNNLAAPAARSLVELFDVVCQMKRWNFQI